MKGLLTVLALVLVSRAFLRAEDNPPRLATPFAEEASWAPVMGGPQPGSLSGLINFNFTNRYVTNHGLQIENQGLGAQPLLLLSTPLYVDHTAWLSNVTFTAGGWSTWHSHEGGTPAAHWRELDLFGGLTFTLARDWKLTAFYTHYLSPNSAFHNAWEMALALSYDDSRLLGPFALHPFVEFRSQSEGNTTVVFNPALARSSYVFKLGINPSCQIGPVKVELPAFFTLVPDGFYQRSNLETRHITYYGYDYTHFRYYPIDYAYQVQTGRPAGGGIGYFTAALKATVPVPCLSNSHVTTSVYGAVQYYRMVNAGLLDGNQVLGAASARESDLAQFHLGINVSF